MTVKEQREITTNLLAHYLKHPDSFNAENIRVAAGYLPPDDPIEIAIQAVLSHGFHLDTAKASTVNRGTWDGRKAAARNP